MFEKIFQKLKENRSDNSNVSDRTLEALARSLEIILTTDELLEAYNAKPAIESIEGNIRHNTSEAVKTSLAQKEADELKRKADKEKAEKEKAKREKALKDQNGGNEPPEYVKEILELNQSLVETVKSLTSKVDNMEKSSITSSRQSKLDEILNGVPEYLANPIKNSFKIADFEDDVAFNTYLIQVQESTKLFQENAKKQGLNTITPSTEVRKPVPNGQTPEISKARDLVNKAKEKSKEK